MDKYEERFDRLEQHMTQLIEMVGNLAKRMDNVEQRLDNMDQRLDNVEHKLDAFQTVTLERFDKQDDKMDFLTNKWVETDLEVFRLKKQQSK